MLMEEIEVYSLASKHGHLMLAGIVGSTAYGLNHANSDIDRLGLYGVNTVDLFKLQSPEETLVYHDPQDATFHEAAKYIRLVLRANPTVLELLWLDDYEIATEEGLNLVSLKEKLLGASRVKEAYLGYATSQFKRLSERGGTFSSDTANRTQKHARHMARLVNQGYELYTTGKLTLKVSNPDWYHQFSLESHEHWAEWFDNARLRFEKASSCLPELPDTEAAENWLRDIRLKYLAS